MRAITFQSETFLEELKHLGEARRGALEKTRLYDRQYVHKGKLYDHICVYLTMEAHALSLRSIGSYWPEGIFTLLKDSSDLMLEIEIDERDVQELYELSNDPKHKELDALGLRKYIYGPKRVSSKTHEGFIKSLKLENLVCYREIEKCEDGNRLFTHVVNEALTPMWTSDVTFGIEFSNGQALEDFEVLDSAMEYYERFNEYCARLSNVYGSMELMDALQYGMTIREASSWLHKYMPWVKKMDNISKVREFSKLYRYPSIREAENILECEYYKR